ncbi:RHS repeat-associated core domain-containing protein, partial [Nocardiopsis ansamitocini]|uniref:RHS repeat-associated core domain-containing protein n=1 Tax=Nocardiopsis ansamitocini TaxID=1670832 RepID=UPI0025563850
EYDPTIGRFVSADPILDFDDAQQINGYIYANNNPMTYTDPDGLFWKSVWKKAKSTAKSAYKKTKKTVKSAYKKTKKTVKSAYRSTKRFVKKHRNTIISTGVGIAVGAACSALTVGAGTAGCAILGGAVSGWVGYRLSTPRRNRSFTGALGATALGGAFGWAGGAIGGRIAGAVGSRAMPWVRSTVNRFRPSTPRPPVRPPTRPAPAPKPSAGSGSSSRPSGSGGASSRSGPSTGRTCSFVPATPVLLADGSSVPIASLSVGASVVAADPEAGVGGAREVVATHVGTGAKRMVEVWVNPASEKAPNPLGAPVERDAEESEGSEGSDGAQGAVGEPVVATANHEFWVADLGEWVAAGELAEGMWLRTPTDTWVQ